MATQVAGEIEALTQNSGEVEHTATAETSVYGRDLVLTELVLPKSNQIICQAEYHENAEAPYLFVGISSMHISIPPIS